MSKKLKKAKIILLSLLIIGIWASIDLGCNFFFSLIPEANDGITISGFWAQLLLPDHGWSRIKYLELFESAVSITGLIASAVIGIDIYNLIKKLKQK